MKTKKIKMEKKFIYMHDLLDLDLQSTFYTQT